MVTRTVLLTALILAFLGTTLSQPGAPSAYACRTAFRIADSLYSKGLAINSETPEGEAREGSINQAARVAFTSFLQCASSVPAADSLRIVALVRRAVLAQYFDDVSAAMQDYRAAIALHGHVDVPDSCFFKPLLFAGIIHYRAGAFDSAESCLERAAAIQESYGRALEEAERLYNNLGALRYESGNYISAGRYFQKALDLLQPSHPYYRSLSVNYKINLAAILVRLGRYEEADKLYVGLLPFNEHRREIDHNRGLIRLNTGRPAEAIRYFARVRYGTVADAGLSNDEATAWIALHRYDSART
ncbi:MAG: hypothetical protein JWP27_1504, partial [Flaviaesturariibacter sp.]|nr:hypothetical protein [Flaviaesturariibacter sp.]